MMIRSTRRSAKATAVLIAAALLSAGCGSGVRGDDTGSSGGEAAATPVGTGDFTPVTITNCGREITVEEPPSTVVGLSPSQTELILRLGLADRLVGQAQVATAPLPDDLHAQATGIPVLSDDTPPNREVLLNTEPDFVFAPTGYEFTAEQGFASIEQLAAAGAQAYVATGGCFDRRMTGTVDDLFTDLENLGAIFGVEEAATQLIEESQAVLDEVAERIDGRDRPRVAQVYVEGNTLSAIGAGIEYDIILRAGGDNVFSPDDDAFADFFAAQINPEALAGADPDALVFAVHSDEHEQATREYLRSTFPDMTAVAEDRLIVISNADVFPGTLGNVRAVQQIAEALYP